MWIGCGRCQAGGLQTGDFKVDSGQWRRIRTGPRGPWTVDRGSSLSLLLFLTQIQSAPSAEVDTGRDGDLLGKFPGQVYVAVAVVAVCCSFGLGVRTNNAEEVIDLQSRQ